MPRRSSKDLPRGTGTGAARRGPFADLTNSGRERVQEREKRVREEKEEQLEREQLISDLRGKEEREEREAAAREKLARDQVEQQRAREREREEREYEQRQREQREQLAREQRAREAETQGDWVSTLNAVDQPVAHDPVWVAEYAEDIFEHARLQELRQGTPPDFLAIQEVISDKMRSILVDWLVEVHLKFKLQSETLFLTVALLDRFLGKKSLARNQLQLCGVTCLLLAAKYEEIFAPEVRDFVSITDRAYTRREIMDMEVQVLNVLNFRLTLPSPLLFLMRFSRLLGDDKQIVLLAQYILELALVDHRMSKHPASHLASASLLLANKVMKVAEPWPEALCKVSHTTELSLRPCAKEMCALLQGAEKSSLQAVRKKFSTEKYGSVAKLLAP